MILALLLLIPISLGAPIPCTNTNPVGCITVNVNYTYVISSTCPCTTCQPGLAVASNGISCCFASISNCQRCNSSYQCINCRSYFGFNSSLICVQCSLFLPNCLFCSTISGGCTTCLETFAINPTGNICVPCIDYMPYCKYCYSSRTICGVCNTTIYAVNTGVSPQKCELCNRTLNECLTCKDASFCYSCTSDRYAIVNSNINSQSCLLCSSLMFDCETCYNWVACKACKSNASYFNSSNYRCQICSKSLPNCKACTSFYNCLACSDKTYALTPFLGNQDMNVCRLCLALMMQCLHCTSQFHCTMCQYGKSTRFGCTKIPGCLQVNSSLSLDQNCLKCATHSFLAEGVNGICICTEGWVVGQFCTTIHGCIGLSIINNQKQCVVCNATSHYIYVNHTCVCKKHYYFVNFACEQICGDGYLYQLQCDDGNEIDGDGCSSKCKVQTHFGCTKQKEIMPASKCKYRGLVQIIPQGIYRIPSSNSVTLSFFIEPYHPIFMKMNLTKSVSFSLQNTILSSSQISDGMMTLTVDFSNNIQGKKAQILISYDQEYVKSPNFKTIISMIQSTGLKLTYQKYSSNSQGQNKIMLIISYCSLICLLLGSLIYRMIGVQTIQTIQIIFLLMATDPDYQIALKSYDELGLAYGILPSYYEPTRGVKNPFFTNLGYDIDLRYNCSTLAYIQLSVIILYLIIRLVMISVYQRSQDLKEIIEQQKDYKIKQQYQQQMKKLNFHLDRMKILESFLYNFLLFPILTGFSFHLINMLVAHILYGSDESKSYLFMGCIVFICIFSANAICSQFINLFTKPRQNNSILRQNKSKYPSIYLFHTFFIFIIPYAIEIVNFKYIYQTGAAFVLIYLIWISLSLPYMSMIDNSAIIVNQLAILFTMIWFILKKFSFFNNQLESIFEKIITAFMGVVLMACLVRIINNIKQIIMKYRKSKDNSKKQQIKQVNFSIIKANKSQNVIAFQDLNIMRLYTKKQRFQQKGYSFNPFEHQVQAKEKLISAKKLYRQKFKKKLLEQE